MGRNLSPPSGVRAVFAQTGERLAVETLAAGLQAASGLPLFADPRFYALRIGCELAFGDEPTTAQLLVYQHHPDPRELGLRIHRALARSWILRAGLPHNADDVESLAHEVALPFGALCGRCPVATIAAQPHVPVAVIRQRFQVLATG